MPLLGASMPPVAFLNYGLLGLCGLIIWLFWRLFDREQRRPGTPRKQILRFSWIFVALSVLLAASGLTLELSRIANDRSGAKQSEAVVGGLRAEVADARTEIARLTERVNAREDLIRRLDVSLEHFAGAVYALPAAKQGTAQVAVSSDEGGGSSPPRPARDPPRQVYPRFPLESRATSSPQPRGPVRNTRIETVRVTVALPENQKLKESFKEIDELRAAAHGLANSGPPPTPAAATRPE